MDGPVTDRSRRRRNPRGSEARVTIGSIAAGGEGVGRLPDGRAVFVHRTAPGEEVEIALTQEHRRWARGRLLRVLTPSPSRRPAPCPHYENCGGCTLEHLEYEAQLQGKARIVFDALTRLGGLAAEVPEVTGSPLEHRYRNRVSFTLQRAGGGRVWAGFHSLGDPSRIVPIDGRCLLPEEPIAVVWDRLQQNWGPNANRLPSGDTLRLTLRGNATGLVSLIIEGGFSTGRPTELLELVEGLASVWHRPDSGTLQWLAGAESLPEVWGTETLKLSGNTFLQVNRRAAAVLEEYVFDLASRADPSRAIDAYCGAGLLARRLARVGRSVVGLELDADAVRIAQSADLVGTRFLQGRVEDLLVDVLPADLLILNPPRSGLDSDVVDTILREPPASVLYVSCDPATLARDLKRMAERYRPASVRCFDLFPQTAHVETVVLLAANP
ncbi:MAG: TRAM domain-containing protein [Gemmatimonas sp.]|nr:TRAM domain-containing protein [Gemmatimonas sp.]